MIPPRPAGLPPLSDPFELLVPGRPLVHWDEAFRCPRPVSEGAVRPDGVVFSAPLLDQDLGLAERKEYLGAEELVAESGVEGLAIAVLPRRSQLYEGRPGVGGSVPVPDLLHGVFRPVSDRMNSGVPCVMNRSVSASTTSVELSLRSALIISASLVNSSMMSSVRNSRPSWVRSWTRS